MRILWGGGRLLSFCNWGKLRLRKKKCVSQGHVAGNPEANQNVFQFDLPLKLLTKLDICFTFYIELISWWIKGEKWNVLDGHLLFSPKAHIRSKPSIHSITSKLTLYDFASIQQSSKVYSLTWNEETKQDVCFTILYCFLPHNNTNQPQVYTWSHPPTLPPLPIPLGCHQIIIVFF